MNISSSPRSTASSKNGYGNLGVGAADPSSITHAIAVDGSALAFLTMRWQRRIHSCDEPLVAGWYALHVKPNAPAGLDLSGIDMDIPSDLPADCIIAIIELGPAKDSSSFNGTPFVTSRYCNPIQQLVALQHPVQYCYSGPCALHAKIQTDIRAALPEQLAASITSNGSDSCTSPMRKRPRAIDSHELALENCPCLACPHRTTATKDAKPSTLGDTMRKEHSTTEAGLEPSIQRMILPCCEAALAEHKRDTSRRLAELEMTHERCQDALLKAESRIAAAEAERQRCEAALAEHKRDTSRRLTEFETTHDRCQDALLKAESRIAAVEAERQRCEEAMANMKQETAARVAEAEKTAKELRKEIVVLSEAEKRLRQKIEAELQSKYDEELRVAEKARVGVLQGVQWQYEFNGRWCAFDPGSSERLLRTYVQYASSHFDDQLRTMSVTSGTHTYEIDFYTMQQTNIATSKSRSIRVSCEVPDTWQKPAEALMWQANLSQMNTQEWGVDVWDVAEKLIQGTAHTATALYPNSTCCLLRKAHVQSIRRVENHFLWRRYQQHVADMEAAQVRAGVKAEAVRNAAGTLKQEFAEMLKQLSGENFKLNQRVNEQWLMHGTDSDTVDKIIESGFDPRVSNTAGFYGAGTYFSSQSCKCHQYTTDAQHSILLSRVALGIPFYTKKVEQSFRRPPPLTRDSQHLHGCVIANEGIMIGHPHGYQSHQEFVIFNGAQAYPQYVITYSV